MRLVKVSRSAQHDKKANGKNNF